MLELENLNNYFKWIVGAYGIALTVFVVYAFFIQNELLFYILVVLAAVNMSLGLAILSILDKLKKIKR